MPSKAAKKGSAGAARRGAAKGAARKSAAKKAARKPAGYIVFISHSSSESWVAGQMAKEAKARGATPWVDGSDIAGGDDFYDRIMEAAHACHEAIVLISPASVKSQWVSFEIGAVAGQGKRVTPVLNNVTADRMEPLRRVNAISLNNFDNYLTQLAERARQHKRSRK